MTPLDYLLIKIASELGYVEKSAGVSYTYKEKLAYAKEHRMQYRMLRTFGEIQEYITGKKRSSNPLTGEVTETQASEGLPEKQQQRADALVAFAAIREWNRIQDLLAVGDTDIKSGYCFRWDANAQGIQLMAGVLGNYKTAKATNILEVLPEDAPVDSYGVLAKYAAEHADKMLPEADNDKHYMQYLAQHGVQKTQLMKNRLKELISSAGRLASKNPLMVAAYGAMDPTITRTLRKFVFKYQKGKFADVDCTVLCSIFRAVMNKQFPALQQFTALVQEAINVRLTNQFGYAEIIGNRPGRENVLNIYQDDRQCWIDMHEKDGLWRGRHVVGIGPTATATEYCCIKNDAGDWVDINTEKIYRAELTKEDQTIRWMTPNGAQWEHVYWLDEQNIVRCAEHVTQSGKVAALTCRKLPPSLILDCGQMLSAMSPNIIHSLDACMLHMVSERAKEDGVELIAVHDEYAVHLCDIEWLQRIIPEMFVKMLQGDVMQQILNDLHLEWVAPAHEVRRQFNINDCAHAQYMFS